MSAMSSEDATTPSEGRRSKRLNAKQQKSLKRGTPEARARFNAKKRRVYQARFPGSFKRRKITKENITKEITETLHKRKRDQLKQKARAANTIKGLLGCSGDDSQDIGQDSCGNILSRTFPQSAVGIFSQEFFFPDNFTARAQVRQVQQPRRLGP